TASAVAHIAVQQGTLVVTADHATVNGAPAPQAVVNEAARVLSFRVSPQELPLGLRITGVTTGPNALTVSAAANSVVLRRGTRAAGPSAARRGGAALGAGGGPAPPRGGGGSRGAAPPRRGAPPGAPPRPPPQRPFPPGARPPPPAPGRPRRDRPACAGRVGIS